MDDVLRMLNELEEAIPDPPTYQRSTMGFRPRLEPPVLIPVDYNNASVRNRVRTVTVSESAVRDIPSQMPSPPEPATVPHVPQVQRLPAAANAPRLPKKKVQKASVKKITPKSKIQKPQPHIVPSAASSSRRQLPHLTHYTASPPQYQDQSYPQDPSPPILQLSSGRSYYDL